MNSFICISPNKLAPVLVIKDMWSWLAVFVK